MNTTLIFYCIIGILISEYLLSSTLNFLNAKRFKDTVPEELSDVYNSEEYKKSQDYKLTNYRFGILTSTFSILLILSVLIFGGFGWIDNFVSGLTDHRILRSLLFFGVVMIGSDLLNTPFSYYRTFVIEEKYGFNKTNIKTFITDKIKGWFMIIVLGGGILSLVLWFFEWAGTHFWLYTWGLITVFTIFHEPCSTAN